MKRREFTAAIATLICEMVAEGETPLLAHVLRSAEEQRRLFDLGLSKCDGTDRVSKHQRAGAGDILFENEQHTGIGEPIKGYAYWHRRWEELGGKPMLDWDKGHFEG